MKPNPPEVTVPVLTRRQFGLIVGGGALLLAAGGTSGVVARSTTNWADLVATAFGALAGVNAGRLARLHAQCRPATESLAAAASRITGPGAVAPLCGASRPGPGGQG